MSVRLSKTLWVVNNFPFRVEIGNDSTSLNVEGMRTLAREILHIIGDGDRLSDVEESRTKAFREIEKCERTIAALKGALTRAKKRKADR